MHGPNHYSDEPDNGHRRTYRFTYVSKYASLEPTRNMVWIYNDEISTYIACGSVPMTRDHFAKLLWDARKNARITITAEYDHLMCECPKQVTTCLDPNYHTPLFHKQGVTHKEVLDEHARKLEGEARLYA